MHVSSVSSAFRRMLQVFVSEYFKSRSGVASLSSPSNASPQCLLCLSAPAGHLLSPPSPLDAGDVGTAQAPRGCVKSA